MSSLFPLLATLCLLLPAGLRAHGLTAELVPAEQAVIVKCAYTNGDPAKAEILVRSPSDATRYFAIIQTDPSGVARFEPDQAGQWSLTADDGLGHRASLRFSVDHAGAVVPVDGGVPSWGRYLALALACGGLLAWWCLLKRRAST
jgi:hypothetical protein